MSDDLTAFIEHAKAGLSAFEKGENCGSIANSSIEGARTSLTLLLQAIEDGDEGRISTFLTRFAGSLRQIPASNMNADRSAWLRETRSRLTDILTRDVEQQSTNRRRRRGRGRYSAHEAQPRPQAPAMPVQAPTDDHPAQPPAQPAPISSDAGAQTVSPDVLFAVIKRITPDVCPRRQPTLPLPKMLEIACAFAFRDRIAPCPETELLRYQYAHFCQHRRLDIDNEGETSIPAPSTAAATQPESGTALDGSTEDLDLKLNELDSDLNAVETELDEDLDLGLNELDYDLNAVETELDEDLDLSTELNAMDTELEAMSEPVDGNEDNFMLADQAQPELVSPAEPTPAHPVQPSHFQGTDPAPAIPTIELPKGNDPAAQRARQIMRHRQARQAQQRAALGARAAREDDTERAVQQNPGSKFV